MTKPIRIDGDKKIETGKSTITFNCVYPEDNPKWAVQEVSSVLRFTWVFDNIENPYKDKNLKW